MIVRPVEIIKAWSYEGGCTNRGNRGFNPSCSDQDNSRIILVSRDKLSFALLGEEIIGRLDTSGFLSFSLSHSPKMTSGKERASCLQRARAHHRPHDLPASSKTSVPPTSPSPVAGLETGLETGCSYRALVLVFRWRIRCGWLPLARVTNKKRRSMHHDFQQPWRSAMAKAK